VFTLWMMCQSHWVTQATAEATERLFSPSKLLPSLVSGILCGIVIIVAAASQAAFIFTGPLDVHLPVGIGISLFGSAVVALIIALRSGVPGMIGATQEVPLASLAIIAMAVAQSAAVSGGDHEVLVTVVTAIGATTLLAGIAFYVMGRFRLGRLIRFIPFPVIAGFLAGTGWLIVRGSIGVIAGDAGVISELETLNQPHVLLKLGLAVAFIALISFLSQRTHSSIALSTTVIAATILFHVAAFLTQTPFAQLRETGWVIDLLGDRPSLWPPLELADFEFVLWPAIAGQWLTIATLIALSSLAVLMHSSGLELALHRDIDLDKELRVAGTANVISGLGGGTVGFQALGLTLLGHRLGGLDRLVGVIVALLCVLFLTVGATFLTFVPKPLFGALLLWVGATLILDWLILTFRRVTAAEYGIICAILLIIVFVGLLPGILFGVIAGLFLFVVDYSKIDVVKNALSGADFHSNVDRSADRRQFLEKHGAAILIYRLQGFLFFGTADRFRAQLVQRLSSPAGQGVRHLVIDFWRVTGVDTSAVVSFRKLAHFTRQREVVIVLTGLNAEVRRAFERSGLSPDQDRWLVSFPDLDRGVEWCEDQLLATVNNGVEGVKYAIVDELAQLVNDRKLAAQLVDYLKRIEFEPSAVMIAQDSPSEEMYFIESGQATVDLKGPGDTHIRLKTLGPGAIVGEIAFYLGVTRTASVVARSRVVAWLFSRQTLERMQKDAPDLAVAFHNGMATMLASRLSSTNRLVQFLMD
jgi:SulP family sulfate permease